MAATDRFRLAVRELPWSPEQVDAEASVIVPWPQPCRGGQVPGSRRRHPVGAG